MLHYIYIYIEQLLLMIERTQNTTRLNNDLFFNRESFK